MVQLSTQVPSIAESGVHVSCAWLDIEDDAALAGDLDIETFPTLLIADTTGVRFFGPVIPSLSSLVRLVEAVASPGAQSNAHDAVTAGLVGALPSTPRLWLPTG
jgi:hypothetical protein